ncbi:DNA-binding transcriptional regulator prophage remnant [Escherichia coli]|nr:DNA-binding transcriptional regulator prophage remnant [Escherichia coli]
MFRCPLCGASARIRTSRPENDSNTCGKSITSVTIWNAAYASQHWKLSINSHQNTPPAFTLQKISRGMICQLHTGETIR